MKKPLKPFVDNDVVEAIALYTACAEYRVLPRPGGLLDQPARLMHIIEATRAAFAEKEAVEAKRQEAEARKQQASARPRR